MPGPTLAFSEDLHATKYREPGETFEQAMVRIASGLADGPRHKDSLVDVLTSMRFMPAGRIQRAIGSAKNVTPWNCYVSGIIRDSFVDNEGSIMQRATEAAQTMRMGGGIGYGFSRLRPHGDLIKGLGSVTDGPLAFMNIYDAICKCVASAGHRRGAQMGVLRCDHPDIRRFIRAKHNSTTLTGFNLSIGVTDALMEAVVLGRGFDLTFEGRRYETVDAQELWDEIMRSTWDWAEPGVLFIDTINKMNNLYYCEEIEATNPCGEQPLPPFGACLLGSFNLARYVRREEDGAYLDIDQLREDVPDVVRAMDNVIDVGRSPLPQQEEEARAKRRMGLGITGLANAAEACGHPYGTFGFFAFTEEIMTAIRDEAYAASALLAYDKGAFPMYREGHYLKGKFVRNLPADVRELIRENGIRNSHLLSVAPTGTISMCADNVSSGLEPVFAYRTERMVNMPGGARKVTIDDYGVSKFGHYGKTSSKVTANEHVRVLCVATRNVDSAVSKTCNVSPDMPWEDFKDIYMQAWKGGAKGCTTFNPGGKRFGIMTEVKVEEPELNDGATCEIGPDGRRSCE